jgi:hypothetical protein
MDNKICMCRCHQKEGIKVLHFMPCCDLSQKKYINPDGSIDEIALKKAEKESKNNAC